MTDLATLGLAVDSGPVKQASAELEKFAAESKKAEQGAKTFEQSAAKASQTAGRLADAVKKSRTSAADIDKRMGIGVQSDTAARAADIEAYGKALDDLRAKYNPLYAAQRRYQDTIKEINQAAKIGAISEEERVAALGHALSAYNGATGATKKSTQAIAENGKTAALSAYQLTNLSFQINDVATQAALGVSPLRILAAQGGQFYQILSQGSGGVTGSLKYILSLITGLVTPLSLAVTGALALVGAGVALAVSWRNAQQQINLALVGTGSAAGLTAASINRISLAAAEAGTTTVGEAREMALAFASTGKIGEEITAELVKQGKTISRIYGEDTSEAAARLAKAFEDPEKGVDDLNKRLGVWDGKTTLLIRNLSAQGRTLEAQRLLLKGVEEATDQASQSTDYWTKGWDKLTGAVSRYFAERGRQLALETGNATLEDQLLAAQELLDTKMKSSEMFGSFSRWLEAPGIEQQIEKIRKLAEELAKVQDNGQKAAMALKSVAATDFSRSIIPGLTELQDATNKLTKLQSYAADSGVTGGMDAEGIANLQKAIALQQRIVLGLTQRIQNQKSSVEIAKEENEFALQGIAARTAAQRAEIAFQQTLSREMRAGNPAAQVEATAAKVQILAEENRRVADEIRNRNFAAAQAVELAQLELSLVGKTADEANKIMAAFQARQSVLSAAFQANRTASPAELRQAEQDATTKAQIESKTRRAQLVADLAFEREQQLRTGTEADVYSRMQSAGLLTNGKIVGAQNEAIAAQIRLTSEIERSIDTWKDFSGSVLGDLMQGKSLTESLANALDNLAQKMLNNSLDLLFAGLGQSGGIPTGGLFGGKILPGIFHKGGIAGNDNAPTRSVSAAAFIGAPRYHNGGIAGLRPDEVPAILQEGERIIPVGGSTGQGGDTFNLGGISLYAPGADAAQLAVVSNKIDQLAAKMPTIAVRAVQDARDRRKA